ncbi:hypothetical protein K461DRAFT_161104 [Myriangium duriaei CBS 260.36]|uniref:Uncharacterized protein n=1 Tax=Myriangium duriaei CBS 260.36 TaxID=1168546 RepID=A0A9P4MF77_9PEZI|nr:hypothetical protein K461DRAFT_161104 [Myriangium duriaei CBS 260.36]
MTSVHAVYENDNISLHQTKPQQHAPRMTGISPRKPLGELHTNALITPHKTTPNLKRSHEGDIHHTSPLKRSSISILDQEKGFQYLKRRRLSPAPQSPSTTTSTTAATTRPASAATSTHAARPAPIQRPTSPSSDASAPSSSSSPAKSRHSSESFTSLINYDPSSQPGGPTPRPGMQHLQRLLSSHQQRAQARTHIDAARLCAAAVAGRAVSASRAQALKCRLRVAVYKVLTGQGHVPFGRLGVFRAALPGKEGRGRWDCGEREEIKPGRKVGEELFGPPIDALRRRRESSGEETIVAVEGR